MYCYGYDFITYITIAAFANTLFCILMWVFMGSLTTKIVVTFFATVIMPFVSFAFENNPLVEAYSNVIKAIGCEISLSLNFSALISMIIYPILYIINLLVFKAYIKDWREGIVDDIIKNLNGSDPYFVIVRDEILKRCENNTLDWGVRNLSVRNFLKLAFKSFLLDIKNAKKAIARKMLLKREQRMRINEEKADLRRKKRFLNTAEI